MHAHPKAGELELSRIVTVARATVHARLARMEQAGVITGYGPTIDLDAAGLGVHAFVTLEIAQGALADVTQHLQGIPGVLEAHSTTGAGDVLCRVAASSHEDLQAVLLSLSGSAAVVRSTSVVVLSEVVAARTLPLLSARTPPVASRAPAYRPPAH